MQYRTIGKTGIKLSILGFGCMRFPVLNKNEGKINEPEAEQMLVEAIKNGVNYFDTAYTYHVETSEDFVGRFLEKGYRRDVYLATKSPCWEVEKRSDMDRLLNEQLTRLRTDHIDFYLLHALTKVRWENLIKNDVFDFIDKAKKDGRVLNIGFSFHDDLLAFKEIIDAYNWDFCQIQYNFMDEEYQAGTEGLRYAAKNGLGVIIMEPLRGGYLTNNLPEKIRNLWNSSGKNKSPAEMALQWVWNHPEVSLVLSGMSNLKQVIENCRTAEKTKPGSLSNKELGIILKVRDEYLNRQLILCTGCNYCLPCPEGVDIPGIFSFYNEGKMYDNFSIARVRHSILVKEEERANKCVECGECLDKCPQQIAIPDELKKCRDSLELSRNSPARRSEA